MFLVYFAMLNRNHIIICYIQIQSISGLCMYPCSHTNQAKAIMPPDLNFSPLRVMVNRLLKTCTRANGVLLNIFRRFSPSKKDNFNSIATFPVAANNAVSINSCARLYGGFVMIWSTTSLFGNIKKSCPPSPYPRSIKSELLTICPRRSRTLLIAPSPHAGSHIVPEKDSTLNNASVAFSGVG